MTLEHGRRAIPQHGPLYAPVNDWPEAYPRARYLSQKFVETLCSIEGMPSLIREIERVIFEAHPLLAERHGAIDFGGAPRAQGAPSPRDPDAREEIGLANLSEQIGIELDKSRTGGGRRRAGD